MTEYHINRMGIKAVYQAVPKAGGPIVYVIVQEDGWHRALVSDLSGRYDGLLKDMCVNE